MNVIATAEELIGAGIVKADWLPGRPGNNAQIETIRLSPEGKRLPSRGRRIDDRNLHFYITLLPSGRYSLSRELSAAEAAALKIERRKSLVFGPLPPKTLTELQSRATYSYGCLELVGTEAELVQWGVVLAAWLPGKGPNNKLAQRVVIAPLGARLLQKKGLVYVPEDDEHIIEIQTISARKFRVFQRLLESEHAKYEGSPSHPIWERPQHVPNKPGWVTGLTWSDAEREWSAEFGDSQCALSALVEAKKHLLFSATRTAPR